VRAFAVYINFSDRRIQAFEEVQVKILNKKRHQRSEQLKGGFEMGRNKNSHPLKVFQDVVTRWDLTS